MERISSQFTFFNKWLFPAVWFGFLGFFMYDSLRDGAAQSDPMFLIIPLGMAVFGFFLMRKLAWDLADSVDDCGSYLLVRRGRVVARIELANVMNVSASTFQNPPRVTLRLVKPSELGKEVSFSPKSPFSLNPFARSPVAEDLIERVHQARTSNAL